MAPAVAVRRHGLPAAAARKSPLLRRDAAPVIVGVLLPAAWLLAKAPSFVAAGAGSRMLAAQGPLSSGPRARVGRRDRPMDRDGAFVDQAPAAPSAAPNATSASFSDDLGAPAAGGAPPGAAAAVVGDDGLPVVGSAPYKARMALLRRIADLDRGSRATPLDEKKIRKLAEKLASFAQEEERWRLSFPEQLPSLEGRWRLLYSSGFVRDRATSSGIRSRPGQPPLDSPVLQVGDIFQVVLQPPRWLRDTGLLSRLPFASGDPNTLLTLTQRFEVAVPATDTLRFAFANGQVASRFFEQLRPVSFPLTLFGLPPDASADTMATDTLITTYCDGDIRLGIGGRFGELRVFRREG